MFFSNSRDSKMPPLQYDPQEQDLIRKLDVKLIPILSLFHFMILMERSNQLLTNLPNYHGNIILKEYFHIDTGDWSMFWSLFIYAIASMLFAIPSALLYQYIGPQKYFCSILCIWGVISSTTVVFQGYGWYNFTRFLLGGIQSG
jgi:hypothetical protein